MLNFYQGKKVLITGHTGFKGAWLSQMLLLLGAKVSGYALAAEEMSLYRILKLEREVASEQGDIRDMGHLVDFMQKVKPEIVIHLAAQPLVRYSYAYPVDTYATNVMGTVHLLEAVRQTSSVKSVVNVTTDKVYENKEWLWGYRENENLCGRDPYSNSKSCSELVTHSYRQSFFSRTDAVAVSTARSGNVIGGGDFAADRIIPDCVRAAAKNAVIAIRQPHSVRPYQHVLECLGGYLLLAQKQYDDKGYEDQYNFGPDEQDCLTTGELVDFFCDAWQQGQTWVAQADNGPHEANFLKLDCSKAKQRLGWKPRYSANQAVAKTVQWTKSYLNHHDIKQETIAEINDYFE